MGKTIAITNQKGGVGKTTTAINLSACLAEAGKKVLLIDLDPQGNCSSGLGISDRTHSIYEVLTGKEAIADCIQSTCVEGLSIIPSSIRLTGAELELVDMEQREYRLKVLLKSVVSDFDFIMIDCQPSLGLLTLNALTAAQRVIIPIQCEYYALEGVSSLMNTISLVKKSFNPGLDLEGVLLTMFDGRTNLNMQVMENVKDHFKNKVFSTVIPRNIRLGEAPSYGQPIHIYDTRSVGAFSYRRLATEVIRNNS